MMYELEPSGAPNRQRADRDAWAETPVARRAAVTRTSSVWKVVLIVTFGSSVCVWFGHATYALNIYFIPPSASWRSARGDGFEFCKFQWGSTERRFLGFGRYVSVSSHNRCTSSWLT